MHDDMDHEGKDWNEGHPDHEAEMALSQLHRIREMAEELLEMFGEDDELQGWVQYKISRAYNDLNDAYGYTEYQYHKDYDLEDEDEEYEIAEGRKRKGKKKKKKGLWDNIRDRREKGLPRKRPGEKGYPKTLNIKSKNESLDLIKKLVFEELRNKGR